MEVEVQMDPISDEQLPGLWDNLSLMSPKRVHTVRALDHGGYD